MCMLSSGGGLADEEAECYSFLLLKESSKLLSAEEMMLNKVSYVLRCS